MSKIRLLIVSVLAAVATLATPVAGQETARNDRPIIDMHMHALPADFRGGEPSAAADEALLRETLLVMDEYSIVKGFLSGPLEHVFRWTEAAPGRFIPSLMFGREGFPDLEALRAHYVAGRLAAMGEITSQYAGIPPNAAVLEPYFALAEELDLPVLIHTAGTGAPRPTFRISAGHPLLLEGVLVRHPHLRLFVESGGYPFVDEMIALMHRYPGVHADLSLATRRPLAAFHDYLQRFMRAGFGKRVMFGSDQGMRPETIPRAIEAIESADFLTEDEKRDIFCNNAAQFLRLGAICG